MNYEMLPSVAHTYMWPLWGFVPILVLCLIGVLVLWGENGGWGPIVASVMCIAAIILVVLTYVPTGTQKAFCTKENTQNTTNTVNGIKYRIETKTCTEFKEFVAVDNAWKEIVR